LVLRRKEKNDTADVKDVQTWLGFKNLWAFENQKRAIARSPSTAGSLLNGLSIASCVGN